MSIVIQNLLVIVAVFACALFLGRSAYRALHGRKSGLNGCGVCTGCATPPAPKTEAPRVAMVTIDALRRSSGSRLAGQKNSSQVS